MALPRGTTPHSPSIYDNFSQEYGYFQQTPEKVINSIKNTPQFDLYEKTYQTLNHTSFNEIRGNLALISNPPDLSQSFG